MDFNLLYLSRLLLLLYSIADAAAATYAATTAEAALQGVGIDITVAQTN